MIKWHAFCGLMSLIQNHYGQISNPVCARECTGGGLLLDDSIEEKHYTNKNEVKEFYPLSMLVPCAKKILMFYTAL
jgi:hypothetical protein